MNSKSEVGINLSCQEHKTEFQLLQRCMLSNFHGKELHINKITKGKKWTDLSIVTLQNHAEYLQILNRKGKGLSRFKTSDIHPN